MPIHILRRGLAHDLIFSLVGSTIFAIGLNCFEIPNGIAAGGAAGLATVISALVTRYLGIRIGVGSLVLAMNALILIPVYRSGGLRYAVRTISGAVASALLTDLLAPFVPVLGDGDLLLCAIWGGVVCGFGVGLIFRAGGSTGGTDVLAQFIAKRSTLSVGTASMVTDMAVVLSSVLAFGVEHALYAAVCLYVGSRLVDMVVDGGNTRRAVYVISHQPDMLEELINTELGLSCTRLMAEQGRRRNMSPVLLVVVGKGELAMLRNLVLEADHHANLIVSSVSETFGEAFGTAES